MLLSYKQIKAIYKSKYLSLTEIFILDPFIVCPSFGHMEDIVKYVHQSMLDDRLVYKNNKMDCDDFALIMNAKVHLYRYNENTDVLSPDMEQLYQYSFGEVFVEKNKSVFNKNPYHMMNSFIDEKLNLYFVEPQNGKIYKQGCPDDKVKRVLHVRI